MSRWGWIPPDGLNESTFLVLHRGDMVLVTHVDIDQLNGASWIVGRCREPDGWVLADALDVLSETSSATSAGLRRQTIPIPRTSLGRLPRITLEQARCVGNSVMQKEDGHPATQGFHRSPRPAWCSTTALCEGFACGDFDGFGVGAD